ncbi:PAS domain-containing protein [Streptomyces sp. NPDC056405]|uniref:PAS domain-containing protein n=1 Tax=Streptomyces sp. NPDC056405 TaxID=3345811 RepID=UPI0035D7BF58
MSGPVNAEGAGGREEGPRPEPYAATAWVDRVGTVQLWSAEAEALLGYPAKEICGTPAVELLTGCGDREAALAVRDRPEAGQSWDGELALRHRDGHQVRVALRVRPLMDREGRAGWWVSAEDARRIEREDIDRAMMRALFEQHPAPIAIMDGELRYRLLNGAAERTPPTSNPEQSTGFCGRCGKPVSPSSTFRCAGVPRPIRTATGCGRCPRFG